MFIFCYQKYKSSLLESVKLPYLFLPELPRFSAPERQVSTRTDASSFEDVSGTFPILQSVSVSEIFPTLVRPVPRWWLSSLCRFQSQNLNLQNVVEKVKNILKLVKKIYRNIKLQHDSSWVSCLICTQWTRVQILVFPILKNWCHFLDYNAMCMLNLIWVWCRSMTL